MFDLLQTNSSEPNYIRHTLDRALIVLWGVITLILLTGGLRTSSGFEIAELDVFGFILLAVSLVRWKITGSAIPQHLEELGTKIARTLSQNPLRILCAIIFCHTLLYTWILIWRFQSFRSNAFDLGFIDQAIWSTAYLSDEKFLHSSISKGGTYLGEHFSPILALFVPLYKLWPSTTWLFLAQSILLSGSAILIYFLARQFKNSPSTSVFLALVFLLFQPLRSANLFDFREDVFFVPIFLGCIFTLHTKRWLVFWPLALVSFAVKENSSIVTFFLGLWLIVRKEKAQGFILCALSLFVFYVVNFKLLPYFAAGATKTVIAGRLGAVGSNISEIITNLLFHPFDSIWKVMQPRLSSDTFRYLYKILLLFLSFIRFAKDDLVPLLCTLSLLTINLLIGPQTLGFHYECILLPFLFFLLVRHFPKRADDWGLGNAIAICAILTFCIFGRSPILSLREFVPTADQRRIGNLLADLPQTASVSVMTGIHPAIDHRRDANLFRRAADTKEDFIILSFMKTLNRFANEDADQEGKKIDEGKYQPLLKSNELSIWCRKDACKQFDQGLIGP